MPKVPFEYLDQGSDDRPSFPTWKSSTKEPIWNYHEEFLLNPKTKYDIIKGHREHTVNEVEKALSDIDHEAWRRQCAECPGEGSCHGSIGWCPLCGDVDEVCDVEWPHACHVHERFPEKPPIESPPTPSKFQRFLPGLNPRETFVKLHPQPYFDPHGGLDGHPVWIWQYDRSSKAIATDPTKSKTVMEWCPYPVGMKVGRETVTKVEVVRLKDIWYWKLEFPILTCEHCGVSNDQVEPWPAQTAYHWDGTGEDPNRDVVLCPACHSDYSDHWQEMWNEYYRGLL